jgi:NADPH2 dehydrogenase
LQRNTTGQRASVPGTLIITEATFISPRASGYPNVPGIYNADQVAAWKEITDVVHAKGSFIHCQLWALGRTANPDNLKSEGLKFVSPSATPIDDKSATPYALTEEEIWEFVDDYKEAARKAIEAGFDGVEIHGANGYLVDQFTQDTCNKRTDAWGGSVEKRARFGIEVAKAVIAAVGAGRTGIRLSPFSTFQGMKMADPIPGFSYLAEELKKLKLAYLHVVMPGVSGSTDVETTEKVDFLVNIWGKTSPVLLAGGFKPDSAKRAVDEEYEDKDIAIVFGRFFTSNPDLPFRVKEGIEFAPYERGKFYNAKEKDGYITYLFSKEFEAAKP